MVVEAPPKRGAGRPDLTELEWSFLGPRPQLTISEWAAEHIWITEGPAVGQGGTATQWNPDTFPLQRDVLNAIEDDRWTKVALMTSPQAFGKTQSAAMATLLHAIHHRKVSAAYVAANLNLAVTQWTRKIEPAMRADAELRQLIFENVDFGGSKVRRDFTNGTSLHCTGADSAGALSAFTAPVVVCDDVQAHPVSLPGFGHPVDLAFTRAEAYPAEDITLVLIGTAKTVDDYLWRTMVSSALFMPFVPCPKCGTYQLLEFPRLQYDDSSPAKAKRSTWLPCARDSCSYRIVFSDLDGMLAEHRWVSCAPGEDWVTKPATGGTKIGRTAKVYPHTSRTTDTAGFWCNALYWPLGKTWGERVAEYLKCRGDPDQLKNHQQQVRVVPWEDPEEDEAALTVEAMAEHKQAEHRKGIVPAEVDLVTLTADVHDRFLYYIVRGWRKADGTSWLIDAGTLGVRGPKRTEDLTQREKQARVGHAIREALVDLWTMEARGWPIGGGAVSMNAALALIDGMYRPDAVGQFCAQRNAGQAEVKWRMVQGHASTRGTRAIWPRQARRNKRGHPHWDIGVDEAKHLLRELLSIPGTQAGAWHTYSDVSLEAYHRHMVSEHFIVKRRNGKDVKVWEKRDGGGPNHWWDCDVYQIAAAIACGVRFVGHLATEPEEEADGWFRHQKRRRSA